MKNLNIKKVDFVDVKSIFEGHKIWSDVTELYWYQMAWGCLEKENLTDYTNNCDLAYVYIRAFTLLMIYGEFCNLVLKEDYPYEFFRDTVEEVLSDFIIGQLIMKVQFEFNKLQNHYCEIQLYGNEDIESVFLDLIEEERYKVFVAIEKNISKSQDPIFSIFIAMYITAVTPYKNIKEKITEEILSYESYLSVYQKHFNDISELIEENDEAFGWLLEGTHRI